MANLLEHYTNLSNQQVPISLKPLSTVTYIFVEMINQKNTSNNQELCDKRILI